LNEKKWVNGKVRTNVCRKKIVEYKKMNNHDYPSLVYRKRADGVSQRVAAISDFYFKKKFKYSFDTYQGAYQYVLGTIQKSF
jgi:hypothetical protein